MGRSLCRHCQERYITRPRGLCWGCYSRSAIRGLYCSAKKTEEELEATVKPGTATRRPTSALPGSRDKVRVLARRFARGNALWHVLDARRDDS